METVQIKIIKKKELFQLTNLQRKSISISRRQIKRGKFKTHDIAMKELREWLKEK
jgi:hypothetical protein